jgi:CRP-like cAMP-binding protein
VQCGAHTEVKSQKSIKFERSVKLMAGRPAQDVNLDEIRYLLAFNFKIEDIADILGVSRSTLYRHMKGLRLRNMLTLLTGIWTLSYIPSSSSTPMMVKF